MTQLLQEFNNFEYKREYLKEEKIPGGKSKLILRGIIQRADTLNQNGRIYPLHILEKEMRNYQKLIKERRALGALDHTDSSIIELNTVSHLITEAKMENGVVYGTLEVLPTPAGEILRNLVESDVTIGISSRGLGSTRMDERGYQMVQDDFQLVGFDVVGEPSTPGAWLMKEGRQISPQELKKVQEFFKKSDKVDRILNDIINWENK